MATARLSISANALLASRMSPELRRRTPASGSLRIARSAYRKRPTWRARRPLAAAHMGAPASITRSEFENRVTPIGTTTSSHLLYRMRLRARQLS
jgi:hypothetical protein